MNNAKIVDVIVIGAGIIGASLAFRLSQQGARVAIVDRSGPAAGATGSSFAYRNASHKTPHNYFALNLAGIRAHKALVDELGEGPWSFDTGRLAWSASSFDDLTPMIDRTTSWGYAPAILDRVAIRDLEPNLVLESGVERAVFFPDEGAVDVVLLTQRLIDEGVNLGAEAHFGQEVTGFVRYGERVEGIHLGDGTTLLANVVVNCAGPDADHVAALAGRTLPMSPVPGLIVRVEGATGAVSRVVYAPSVQIRPDTRENGMLLLHHHPADDAVLAGESPSDWAEELANRARQYLPAFPNLTVNRWAIGTRALPADGKTSAGMLAAIPGYAEIVTHSGVTLGPLLGQLIAEEITSGTVSPLLASFRPDRFNEAFAFTGTPNLLES